MLSGNRIWVMTELYHPEVTSTGHLISTIAEGLAEKHDVRVICAQPTYANRGTIAARREVHNNVAIFRCRGSRFDKDRLVLRGINMITFGLSALIAAVLRFRRGDQVIVLTNPPILPFVALLACKFSQARMTLLIHDLYPDVLFRTGLVRSDSLAGRALARASRFLLESCDTIVVLGRDMRRAVLRRAPSVDSRVRIIPNFAGLDEIEPKRLRESTLAQRHGITESFVVQYLGNMGRTHDLESIVAAAGLIAPSAGIEFLLAGWGAKREWLDSYLSVAKLPHVHLVPPCSREQLTDYLSAATVSLIALIPGMAGISVPSRLYDVMAAARPIIAMVDSDAELAQIVEEERIGWVVRPGDAEALAALLVQLASGTEDLEAIGRRGRAVAESKYSRAAIHRQYIQLFGTPESPVTERHEIPAPQPHAATLHRWR
jgi:colanic acid biosynthesis glycosyl transferase WcaI